MSRWPGGRSRWCGGTRRGSRAPRPPHPASASARARRTPATAWSSPSAPDLGVHRHVGRPSAPTAPSGNPSPAPDAPRLAARSLAAARTRERGGVRDRPPAPGAAARHSGRGPRCTGVAVGAPPSLSNATNPSMPLPAPGPAMSRGERRRRSSPEVRRLSPTGSSAGEAARWAASGSAAGARQVLRSVCSRSEVTMRPRTAAPQVSTEAVGTGWAAGSGRRPPSPRRSPSASEGGRARTRPPRWSVRRSHGCRWRWPDRRR